MMLKKLRFMTFFPKSIRGKHARRYTKIPVAGLAIASALLTTSVPQQVQAGGSTLVREPKFDTSNIQGLFGLTVLPGVSGPSIEFVDVDHDGDLDLVFTGSNESRAYVIQNSGSKTNPAFLNTADGFGYYLGSGPAISVADESHDGDLDLLAVAGGPVVKTFRNTGDAVSRAFTGPYTGGINNVYNSGGNIKPTLVDIDCDGDQDLFLLGPKDASYEFFRNDGGQSALWNSGAFSGPFTGYLGLNPYNYLPNIGLTGDTASDPITFVSFAFSDMDHDGDPDAVINRFYSGYNTMYLMKNTGDASNPAFTFDYSNSNLFGIDSSVYSGPMSELEFADLDGDGDEDAIMAFYNGTIFFAENTTDFTQVPYFRSPIPLGIGFDGPVIPNSFDQIQFANIFNGNDANLYNLNISGSNSTVRNYLNLGDAANPEFYATNFSAVNFPNTFVSGETFNHEFHDVDADGDLDLIAGARLAGGGFGTLLWEDNRSSPSSSPDFASGPVPFGNQRGLSHGDIDGDGDTDRLGNGQIFLNSGNAISPYIPNYGYTNVNIPYKTSNMEVADIDNDGDLDFIQFDTSSYNLYFRRNNGDATNHEFDSSNTEFEFTSFVSNTAYLYMESFDFFDIDKDGDLDLIGVNNYGGVYLFENTPSFPSFDVPPSPRYFGYDLQREAAFEFSGTIDLQPFGFYNSYNGSQRIDIADINSDGDLDIFSGSANDSFIRYSENSGDALNPIFNNGVTGPYFVFRNGYSGSYSEKGNPAVGDLDADGDFDAFSGGGYDSPLVFAENDASDLSGFPFSFNQSFEYGISPRYFNYGAPSLVDIDQDGDLDLFIVDTQYGGGAPPKGIQASYSYPRVFFFENTGNAKYSSFNSPQINPFGLDINSLNEFPYNYSVNLQSNIDFADVDNDGDFDAVFSGFVYDPLTKDSEKSALGRGSDLFVATNTGDAINPAFEISRLTNLPYSDLLNSDPVFADLDADGDYDLFVGLNYGGAYFFENTSSAPDFTNFPEPIYNLFGASILIDYDTFYQGSYFFNAVPNGLIDTVAKDLTDIDGDGDLDLLRAISTYYTYYDKSNSVAGNQKGEQSTNFYYGSRNLGYIVTQYNTGDAINPAFDTGFVNSYDYRKGIFPETYTPLYFSYARERGLAKGPGFDPAENYTEIPYQFDYAQANILSSHFADLDRDGDQDLVAQVGFRFAEGGQKGFPGYNEFSVVNVLTFENYGSAIDPSFAPGERVFGFPYYTSYSAILLDVADIDGDGDHDLIMASAYQSNPAKGDSIETDVYIYSIENTNNASSPAFNTNTLTSLLLLESTPNYTPSATVQDFDADGDLDMMVAFSNFSDTYFSMLENTGDRLNPAFELISDPFDRANNSEKEFGLLLGIVSGDLDGDGDFEILFDNLYYIDFAGEKTTTVSNKIVRPIPGPSGLNFESAIPMTIIEGGVLTNGPTADVLEIENADQASTSVSILFSEPITGFDISDLLLLNPAGQPIDISSLSLSGSEDSYVLEGLDTLGLPKGPYTLIVKKKNTGITDSYGAELRRGDAEPFVITGTPVNSSLVFEAYDPFGITAPRPEGNARDLAPAFGDIDFDGDLDLFAGVREYGIYNFENEGSRFYPSFGESSSDSFGLYTRRENIPTLVDIDADGDLDMLVGGTEYYYYYGNYGAKRKENAENLEKGYGGAYYYRSLIFFENTGSDLAPEFAPPVYDAFGVDIDNYGDDPAPAFVDIDADGDLDLFIGYDGEVPDLIFFRNTGTASEPAFAREGYSPFGLNINYDNYGTTIFTDFSRPVPNFVDIDCDGDLDAFIGDDYNVQFFRNTGTPQYPAFEYISGQYDLYGYEGFENLVPRFFDIDKDGDLDAFVGDEEGYTTFFRNSKFVIEPPSVDILEIADTDDAPTSVSIVFNRDVVNFGLEDLLLLDPAGHPVNNLTSATLQGSGSVFFLQGLDQLGLQKGPHTLILKSSDNTDITALDGRPVMDGDVEPFAITGAPLPADFVYESYDPFGFSTPMIFDDTGFEQYGYDVAPSFADLNADGDLDLVVGNNFRNYGFPNIVSKLHLFENNGDEYTALFNSSVSEPFGLSLGYSLDPVPTFVDIDADGDLDAFVGYRYQYLGKRQRSILKVFENTGSSSDPAFEELPLGLPGLNIYDQETAPTFVDIDLDGDLDAFVGTYHRGYYPEYKTGNYTGEMKFFRNVGSASSPQFSEDDARTLGLKRYFLASHISPNFIDIDCDGDLDAYIGTDEYYFSVYTNTGSAANPAFTSSESSPYGLFATYYADRYMPRFFDIDSDGDLDAFVGDSYGTITFFRNNKGIDETPPYVYAPNDEGQFTNDNDVYFFWTAPNDPDSAVDYTRLVVGTTPYSNDIGEFDVTGDTDYTVPDAPEGNVYAYLYAFNSSGYGAGSGSSNGIFVDTQVVEIDLDQDPFAVCEDTPTISGTFLDPDPSSGVTGVEFRPVNTNSGVPTSPSFITAAIDGDTSGTWSGVITPPLPEEGIFDLEVRGIDNAMNRELNLFPGALILDQTPPVVVSLEDTMGRRNDFFVNAPFELVVETSDNLTSVVGFDPNTTPDIQNINNLAATFTEVNTGPNTFSFLVEPQVEGPQYELQVGGPDAVFDLAGKGNVEPSNSVTFTYDITPPEVLCSDAFRPLGGSNQSIDEGFIAVRIEFTEPVIGVDASAFNVNGPGSIEGVINGPGPNTSFELLILTFAPGFIDISINPDSITDRAGNDLIRNNAFTAFRVNEPVDNLPDPAPTFPTASSSSRYGDSVALSLPYAFIGAPGYATTGGVFVSAAESSSTFTHKTILAPQGLDSGDNFGDSVAASGDWLIVGATGDDEDATNAGAVYFYRAFEDFLLSKELPSAGNATFELAQIGVPSDLSDDVIRQSRFGTSVDISDTVAVVGEPFARRGGRVSIYTLDVCGGDFGDWIPTQVIVPNDLTPRDQFGISVSLSNGILAVGSSRDDDFGSDTGAVYLFEEVGGGLWIQSDKIVPGSGSRLDRIGTSVSMNFIDLGFGAPGDDTEASGAGAVYIYNSGNRKGGFNQFFPQQFITSSNTSSGDGFGSALDLDFNNMIVTAPFSDLNGRDAGAAFIYSKEFFLDQTNQNKEADKIVLIPIGGDFIELETVTFPEPTGRNDRFGTSVAIDSTVGLVGAPYQDQDSTNNGAALYIQLETGVPDNK